MESFDNRQRIVSAFQIFFAQSFSKEIDYIGNSLHTHVATNITRLRAEEGAAFEARKQLGSNITSYCQKSVAISDIGMKYITLPIKCFPSANDVPRRFFDITVDKNSINSDARELCALFHVTNDDISDFSDKIIHGLQTATHLIFPAAQRAYSFALEQLALPSLFMTSQYQRAGSPIVLFVKSGVFSIERHEENIDLIETHALVFLALEDIHAHGDHLKLHNIDPDLQTYINDYYHTFEGRSESRDILLYIHGYKIHLCIDRLKRKLGQIVDEGIIVRLQILLVAHESYIFRFSRVRKIVEDEERIRTVYAIKGNSKGRALLVKNMAGAKTIFDSVAQTTFNSAAGLAASSPHTYDIVAESTVNAILAGTGYGMGRVLLAVRFTTKSVGMNVLGAAATQAFANTRLYGDIVAFLKDNSELISQISEDVSHIAKEPHSLAWLGHLIDIVQKL